MGLFRRVVDRALLGPEEGRDAPDPDCPRPGERWRFETASDENDSGDDESR